MYFNINKICNNIQLKNKHAEQQYVQDLGEVVSNLHSLSEWGAETTHHLTKSYTSYYTKTMHVSPAPLRMETIYKATKAIKKKQWGSLVSDGMREIIIILDNAHTDNTEAWQLYDENILDWSMNIKITVWTWHKILVSKLMAMSHDDCDTYMQ